MEADSAKRPRSFEDAAFALVQALSPGKQLSKEHIPFKQLRQVINNFVNENPQQMSVLTGRESPTAASDTSKALSAEEKLCGSNLDLSDDSSSRVSFDDSVVSRSKNYFRSKNCEQMGSKTYLHKIPKRSRKLMQMRSRRREALQIKDFIPLDCSETDLSSKLPSVYKEQLSCRSTSVEAFFVLLNSLRNFFHHTTWSDNVEKLVNGFLERHVFKKCAELGNPADADSTGINEEIQLREYELMVLIELHLIQDKKGIHNLEDTDILSKMRYIYFVGGADRMHKFLNESMTDLFADVLPEFLFKIYVELCVSVPCDLEDYANMNTNNVESESAGKSSPMAARKATQNERLDRLLKDDSDTDYKPSTSAFSDLDLAPVKAKRPINSTRRNNKPRFNLNSKIDSIAENSSSPTLKHGISVSRPFIVPETPEAKVKKRKQEFANNDEERKRTVKQTPIAKMTKVGSKKVNRYSALLRKSSSRTLLNCSVQNDFLQSPTASPPRKFSTRSQAREQFLPSPLQSSQSFSNSGLHRNDVRKSSFLEKLAQCGKQSYVDNLPPQQHLQHETIDDFSLEKPIVDKYRKRLEYIRHAQKKVDKNEVFYGRSAKRNNLFLNSPDDEVQVGVITRSSANAIVQKNRSGRSVVSNRVHLAHALLNVHNNKPLSPSKPPKNSPFKLPRMVRPATKSSRKQLSKLKLRSNRDKITTSVCSNKSPIVEASSLVSGES